MCPKVRTVTLIINSNINEIFAPISITSHKIIVNLRCVRFIQWSMTIDVCTLFLFFSILLIRILYKNNRILLSDCLHLQLYRDSKDRYKQGMTKASLSLENFLGTESGICG